MKKILQAVLVILMMAVTFQVTLPSTAYAEGRTCNKNPRFLTFPTWYNGLIRDDCTIQTPSSSGENGDKLAVFAIKIGLNVIEALLQAVAYVTAGFIIYGGFRYLTALGEADKISGAKKTVQNAIIGLIISLVAVIVVSFASSRIGL